MDGWGRHLPAVSLAVTVGAIAALSLAGSLLSNRMTASLAHGVGHAVVGLPVAVLGVVVVLAWPAPRPTTSSRVARRIITGGLAGVALGQLLEVAGARVDEPNAHAIEDLAHTAGQIVTMLSMLALLAGGALAAVSAVRTAAVPRWVVAICLILASIAFILVFVGAPGS